MVDYDERGRVLRDRFTAWVRPSLRDKSGGTWWSFLLRGVFAIVLGLFALFWPTLSLGLLARAVGFYFVADGVAGLVTTLRTAQRGAYLVQPALSLAVGTVLILWPEGSLRLLLVAFGAWVLAIGIRQIVQARQLADGDPARPLMTSIGALFALLGLALMLLPGSGLVVITWAIALAALAIGGQLAFFALRLRQMQPHREDARA